MGLAQQFGLFILWVMAFLYNSFSFFYKMGPLVKQIPLVRFW